VNDQQETGIAVASGESGPLPELGDGKFTPREALLLAWFGLGGGFLELGALLMAKSVLRTVEYYEQPRFFPALFRWPISPSCWCPGLLVATLNRLRPGLVPLTAAFWVFATLMKDVYKNEECVLSTCLTWRMSAVNL
jgi:hypothetical protein